MKQRVFCLLLLMSLMCTGCAAGAVPTETALATVPPQTETAVPTTAPTETTLPTETAAPICWEDNIHSGLLEDGSFGEGAVFIGDSLTVGLVCQYLMPEGFLGQARYMAQIGAPLRQFFSRSTLLQREIATCSWQFYDQTYWDAAAIAGKTATAVYFMLGTNFDIDNNAESYIRAVEYLLEVCPNATIYLQTIPMSSSDQVHCPEVNASIAEARSHFAQLGIQRVMVIDTCTGIGENTISDGVHLSVDGYRLWYETIVRFMEENQIPQ